MKLIDFLVQELPKRGGWPNTADLATAYKEGGYVWFFNNGYVSESYPAVGTKGLEEFGSRITREQYAAALSASQQPAWIGEGLPPVGCECEYKVRQAANLDWKTCTVIAAGKENLIADVNGEEAVFFAPQIEFRPIRYEADRKREETIDIIANLCHRGDPGDDAAAIYDAIAAGEIRGIRLE